MYKPKLRTEGCGLLPVILVKRMPYTLINQVAGKGAEGEKAGADSRTRHSSDASVLANQSTESPGKLFEFLVC